MSETVWAAQEKLQEALEIKHRELIGEVGSRYASVMEGYGNMVAAMNITEEYFKECRRSVKKFGANLGNTSFEYKREVLEQIEREAAILTAAALSMAGRIRLFRDTVIDMGGGDLVDMIDEAGAEQ